MHGSRHAGDRIDERRAFVYDLLDELGWEVVAAEAHEVKGPVPLAYSTDRAPATP
jgi:hypothetical protein